MDIQHFSALIETLSALGFPASTNRNLLFNTCLRQKSFVIRDRMCFGEDTITYQLYFKEETASKKLICAYYDATLKKAVEIAATVVNGIDIQDLQKRMAAVNWQMPSEISSSGNFKIEDKNTWKQEAVIAEITRELETLAETDEGAYLANLLKYKFWTNSSLQDLVPKLSRLKGMYELNQRFFIINGDGITAPEAYRFLNNRWMERQIHADSRMLRLSEAEQKEAKGVIKGTPEKKKNRHLKENSRK